MTNIQLAYQQLLADRAKLEEQRRHNAVTEAQAQALNEAQMQKLRADEANALASADYTKTRNVQLGQEDSYGNTIQDYTLRQARYDAGVAANKAGDWFSVEGMETVVPDPLEDPIGWLMNSVHRGFKALTDLIPTSFKLS